MELTTPLSKLVGILWLPLSRIYKLGYSYPRRLSRSPAVVGYQACFLAPLPGSIALYTSLLEVFYLVQFIRYGQERRPQGPDLTIPYKKRYCSEHYRYT